jgi:hypothetical protein
MTKQTVVIAYKDCKLVFFEVFPEDKAHLAAFTFRGLRQKPETEVTRSHMMDYPTFAKCLLHGIEAMEEGACGLD